MSAKVEFDNYDCTKDPIMGLYMSRACWNGAHEKWIKDKLVSRGALA